MKLRLLFNLLLALSVSFTSMAKTIQHDKPLPYQKFFTSIDFSENKQANFLLPNSCSGLLSDYIEGNGDLSVSVQGKIQNGQVAVRVKVDYTGTAKSTIGILQYSVSGNINTPVTKSIASEPVDIFVTGYFKLISKGKTPSLYLGDIGFITVYPDGRVVNHLLDATTDPNYSHANIYCSSSTIK